MASEDISKAPRSADDLDKCMQVTPPGAWMVIIALAAFLAGAIVWAVFGTVATRVPATAAVIDGTAICFVSEHDAAKMHEGDIADVGKAKLEVDEVSAVPVSRDEAKKTVESDYLLEALFDGSWAYQVTFAGDVSGLAEGVPIESEITVDRLPPIRLLVENGE